MRLFHDSDKLIDQNIINHVLNPLAEQEYRPTLAALNALHAKLWPYKAQQWCGLLARRRASLIRRLDRMDKRRLRAARARRLHAWPDKALRQLRCVSSAPYKTG